MGIVMIVMLFGWRKSAKAYAFLNKQWQQFPADGDIMGKVPRVIRPPEGEAYVRD